MRDWTPDWLPDLTEAERRGARLLALLLLLGTAHDLWRAHTPRFTPEFAGTASADTIGTPDAASHPDPTTAAAPAPILDLNTAGVAELDQLPGIGPVLAGRIVEHRRRHGRFRNIDELLSVPGIGPRLLERLRPAVRATADRTP